jgi:serine/threonine-protein kinase
MPAFCPSCGQKLVSAPPRPDFCPHCQNEALERGGWEFGDYEILGKIAQGGMGIVYCARQISTNRPVALKMLRSGRQASAEERERFRTEARAASHLDHPNIVPIYEVGEQNGEPYFSMRLLEGNLATLIEEWGAADHRTQGDRAALIAKLARAAHHAHSRGVLHRDIKPTNILMDQHGEPHLGDFGLARIAEKGSTSSNLTSSLARQVTWRRNRLRARRRILPSLLTSTVWARFFIICSLDGRHL